jgi:diacylglycerol O-acyltransferase
MDNRLTALDLAFLALETQKTPVNVAGLTIYEIPRGYRGNYVRDLLETLLTLEAGIPFNLKLSSTSLSRLPSWVIDEDFDLEYHVRHSALPRPGKMADLMSLVSRLHSHVMDRERPLWEFHLIEGLEGNRFATYMKMHHAAIDGMGGIEVLENCFSTDPTRPLRAPWALLPSRRKTDKELSGKEKLERAVRKTGEKLGVARDLGKIFWGQGLKAVGLRSDASPIPFSAPPSLFNQPICGARRFAVRTISLSDVKALGKQADATVNDMVLAICSGALHNFMVARHALPERSLVATVPVSVRQVNRSGNQITYVAAKLATEVDDPIERLARIGESTRQAKAEIRDVSAGAATLFATLAQGTVAILNKLDLSDILPPPANVTISNVPGPREPLFFGKARMLANYPLSVLVNGQALNITVVSYCDSIDFGLMGCRETLPDLEDLADEILQALEDLRAAITGNPVI